MRAFTFLVLVSMLRSSASADEAYFTGVGDLPGGSFGSDAFGVSADGRVVVGWGTSAGVLTNEGFVWTREDGIVGIGFLDDDHPFSVAIGVSGDGVTVIGEVLTETGGQAFRWQVQDGFETLGDLPGGETWSQALGASYDGQIVVGQSVSERTDPLSDAFRWNAEDGIQGLGEPPDGYWYPYATAVSHDGKLIAGTIYGKGRNPTRAYLWSADEQLKLAPPLKKNGLTRGYDLSADGQFLVGDTYGSNGNLAIRWSEATGTISLGVLHDEYGYGSIAHGVSGDGRLVVGEANDRTGNHAFVWDEEHGMRRVTDVLREYGVDIPRGWTIYRATDISADGRTIVGVGIGPNLSEGWVAHLPRCNRYKYPLGDSDGSGAADFNDIDCFVAALIGREAWEACDSSAPRDQYDCINDTNADGSVDFGDIDSFVTCLTDGCE